MIRYYVIYDLERDSFLSETPKGEYYFSKLIFNMLQFRLRESAVKKIQELPKGIYEIKTIYVNE